MKVFLQSYFLHLHTNVTNAVFKGNLNLKLNLKQNKNKKTKKKKNT